VHVQAVLSILLATFAGFGVVMSGSSILVEFFRWRRRWQASSEQQHGPLPITQPGQHPQTVSTPRSDQSNHSHPVVQDLQNSHQS
ncbi:putative RING/U-box protein, partial [Trifolium pratense]